MFLFNLAPAKTEQMLAGFKYNFCFSSTFSHKVSSNNLLHLNTTFVSLQPINLSCVLSTNSYLNTTFVSLQRTDLRSVKELKTDLNTTFVSLQPINCVGKFTNIIYLNTTFVSLQRNGKRSGYIVYYLNTTFVSLQRGFDILVITLLCNLNTTFVSLQLTEMPARNINQNYLNTTFVSLQLYRDAGKEYQPKLFKYNFCFSSTFIFFFNV